MATKDKDEKKKHQNDVVVEELNGLMNRFCDQEKGVSEFSVSELLKRTLRDIKASSGEQDLNRRLGKLYTMYHDQEHYVSEFAMTALLNRVLEICQRRESREHVMGEDGDGNRGEETREVLKNMNDRAEEQ